MEKNPFEVGNKSKTTTNIDNKSKQTNNTNNSSSSWDGEVPSTDNIYVDFVINILKYLEENKWMVIIITTMLIPFLDFLVIPAAIFGDEIIDLIVKYYKQKK